ncbi:hypothetical protein K2Z83_26765, partial [Oscillochloris sp. ZM17-4]
PDLRRSPPAVQRAETGRPTSPAQPYSPTMLPDPPPAAPAPDLDALARQVYDVLKRRLAAEMRRRG